jgi:hypothetical protein
MAVDFWADKYWNGQYFNVQYFGQGEESAGAMSASLSGSGDISATLTAVEAPSIPKSGSRRRRRLVVSQLPIRLPDPIPAFMVAKLSGRGDLATKISATAAMSASLDGAGGIQAEATAKDRKFVVEDNQFWMLAA